VSWHSAAIKINDDIGIYYPTLKGLRHCDPLLSMLINIVIDMLAIMIECVKVDGILWMGNYFFFNMLII
jgi:hypothetical protein